MLLILNATTVSTAVERRKYRQVTSGEKYAK